MDGQVQVNGIIPPYLIPGSPFEKEWHKNNPDGHTLVSKKKFLSGSTLAHQHAMNGNYNELAKVLDKHSHLVNLRDKNGWTPLHEAVRKGDVSVLRLVLDRGADVNAQTGTTGKGKSVLDLAETYHKAESHIVQLLKTNGARYGTEL